ncbi:hypothetical protein YC2023_121878 [Brassica napus]
MGPTSRVSGWSINRGRSGRTSWINGYVNCEASWILRDCKEKTLMHIPLGRAKKSLNCGPPFQWLTCSINET